MKLIATDPVLTAGKNTGLSRWSDNDDSGIYWQGWKHGVQEREKISDPYGLQV